MHTTFLAQLLALSAFCLPGTLATPTKYEPPTRVIAARQIGSGASEGSGTPGDSIDRRTPDGSPGKKPDFQALLAKCSGGAVPEASGGVVTGNSQAQVINNPGAPDASASAVIPESSSTGMPTLQRREKMERREALESSFETIAHEMQRRDPHFQHGRGSFADFCTFISKFKANAPNSPTEGTYNPVGNGTATTEGQSLGPHSEVPASSPSARAKARRAYH